MSKPILRTALAAAVLGAGLLAVPAQAAPPGEFDLQAHRGGLGLRPESTLASFGNALQLGVSTLELDIQITKDGYAVVTHDRRINPAKCADTAPVTPGDPQFPYAQGRYIKDLTLAQVQTLDCGARQLAGYPEQQVVPGAGMPLLSEVFDLVKAYDADDVMLNIETKVEAGAPHETAPREQFVQVVAREIRDATMEKQVTIQSFDWGALMRMGEVAPRLRLVALTNYDFLQVDRPGASPWLGGIDIDDFDDDPIAAIESFGADAFSPVHGFPQGGSVDDPGYVPYVTRDMVRRAHRAGIEVVPWTIDDPATMNKLIDDGVDGIITDYPDRLRTVLAERGLRLPEPIASPLDVQAHRGGRWDRPENTLPAFAHALENEAISTLELDTGVTADGVLVVSHDRAINGSHCIDTAPATPGDPEFPYVGDLVRDLTLAQIKTIDCGTKLLPELPEQVAAPGARIPTLDEVFELVEQSGRDDIRFNIETKISPLVNDTAPYQEFTRKLVSAIQAAGLEDRATIQSFDWRTIRYARRLDRDIETVALVWQYGPAECASLADECSLQAVYGDRSVTSPWTGGLDWWRVRDLGRLTRQAGASTVSANWQVHDPAQGTVVSSDWYLREDPSYFHGPTIEELHRQNVKVVPYTINDASIMQRLIDLGVDGIITDDPNLLIEVATLNGLR
ncbi:glycerophosphoryl diester phosphodiesterase [Jiangella mangrovi]|uniref:Glycerophosphoryl diester phosphodiesterase n=1 Tax=Jiangella mangrovi TaxID=1524084 RepID=A0A7W9LN82_9ACTN|nr:glycerophosphodiester phosphodiesterase family protein [Jiangella mangrovi]MBB5789974.1 glycerophosphoryl diester phosphodiesterase [Jiangella mangrovi]